MVEVFITDIESSETAKAVIIEFEKLFPAYKANFDLEDHDKILRIESENIDAERVIITLNQKNIKCKILE
jgi:hypothetical protein